MSDSSDSSEKMDTLGCRGLHHGFVRCLQRGVAGELAPFLNLGAAKRKMTVSDREKRKRALFINIRYESPVSSHKHP
jgi:hypothetical protein